MPAIQIDEKGTRFYYLDSGIPCLTDAPYTTLVCFHGLVFNCNIFKRLLPLAAASHIRLIALNRRGYHGSTPIPDSETDVELASNREDFYKSFHKARAEEIALFLVKLIEIENLPVKVEKPGRASGGLALLGWSVGCNYIMSFLAFADTFAPAIKAKLNNYFRKVVAFDAPFHAWGYPVPEGSYNPYYDLEIPVAEREPKFAYWVSCHYIHSKPSDPNADPIDGLEQRNANPDKPTPIKFFTPEELASIVEMTTNGHGDNFVLHNEHRSYNMKLFYKAFFKSQDESKPVAFPNVTVSYVWCTEAHWDPVYGFRLVQADVEKPPKGLSLARPIQFFALDGGNHYAQHEDPLKTLATLAHAIEY